MHATLFHRGSVVIIFCSEKGDKNYNTKKKDYLWQTILSIKGKP